MHFKTVGSAALLLALVGHCVHLFDRGSELSILETTDPSDPSLENLQQIEAGIISSLSSGGDMRVLGGVANVSKNITTTLDKIVTQMMSKINGSHKQALDEITRMLDPFDECKGRVSSLDKLAKEHNALLAEKYQALKKCLASKDVKEEAKDECAETVDTEEKLADSCDDDNGLKPVACDPAGDETYVNWVKTYYKYFAQEKNKSDAKKKRCGDAEEDAEEKKPDCETAADDYNKQAAKCDKLKRDMESKACEDLTRHKGTCSSSTTCYEAELERFKKQVAEHQEWEKLRKTEWRASKRIDCLVRTFHQDTQQQAIGDCIEKRHDTKHLDLTFPTPPGPPSCPPLPPAPCDQTFLANYDALAGDCKPCPDPDAPVEEITTTLEATTTTTTEALVEAANY